MSPPRALTVYSRAGCGLCEVVLDELEPHRLRLALEVTVVDVDGDPSLAARHGSRVPVLVGPGGEICHYHLDPEALERHFTTL